MRCAVTVEEASEYTGIGISSLRMLIAWEAIPIVRVGKKILIRVESLDKFMKLNEGRDIRRKDEVIAV